MDERENDWNTLVIAHGRKKRAAESYGLQAGEPTAMEAVNDFP
jgi:hypothetical protein